MTAEAGIPGKDSGLLCAAVAAAGGADEAAAMLSAARQSEAAADVIEIRLDGLARPDISLFLEQLRTPLLFTNRPVWEGGLFRGDEDTRLVPLLDAIRADAAYVDIEMKTAEPWREKAIDLAGEHRTRVIISWHDFAATPSTLELEEIFSNQRQSGAHIGKIVTMARNFSDVLRVLNLQLQASASGFPLIAFCMGRVGVISRLATVELGGYMTYAMAEGGQPTAPGQLRVSILRAMLETLTGSA
jgi:3-dehydroquinate dehydratase-1